MSATKTASEHASHALSAWRSFLASSGAGTILEPVNALPSVIALRFRSEASLRIWFADYLEKTDQAHWGVLEDGRRVVVICRARPLDRDALVHIELIESRPFSQRLAEGDDTGFDHLGLRIDASCDLDDLAIRLNALGTLKASVGGSAPFRRLKLVYRDYSGQRHEFKLMHHKLAEVCIADLMSLK